MKTSKEIVDHILNNPLFAKLRTHKCFKAILSSFTPILKKGVQFMYIKNDILYFALKHPGYKMEFDYKKDTVEKIIKMATKIQEDCKELKIVSYKSFVTKFTSEPLFKREDTVPYYKEHSTGLFFVNSKDKEILEKFDEIKDSIKCLKN